MDFAFWLSENADEIAQAQAHSKADLPTCAEQIQEDLNRTTRDFPRVGEWLAEVERYLLSTRAAETLRVLIQYPKITAPERKTLVEDGLRDILHTRDILKTTKAALDQRHFALLNQRNYAREEMRLSGRQEG